MHLPPAVLPEVRYWIVTTLLSLNATDSSGPDCDHNALTGSSCVVVGGSAGDLFLLSWIRALNVQMRNWGE